VKKVEKVKREREICLLIGISMKIKRSGRVK